MKNVSLLVSILLPHWYHRNEKSIAISLQLFLDKESTRWEYNPKQINLSTKPSESLFRLTSNVNVPLWLRSITANKYRLYFAASTRREHDDVEEHLTHTHCLAGKIEDKWHVIVLHSRSRLDIPIECIIDQRNAEEKSQGLLLVWNFDRVIEFLIWRIVYISWFLPEIEDVENFEIVEHPIVYLKKIFDNEMCPNNSKRTPIRTTPTSNSFLSFYEMKTSLSGRKRRYISTHVWYQLMGLIWAKTRCISHQLSHWVEYAENKLSWHLLAKGEHSHVCIIKQCLYRSLIYMIQSQLDPTSVSDMGRKKNMFGWFSSKWI